MSFFFLSGTQKSYQSLTNFQNRPNSYQRITRDAKKGPNSYQNSYHSPIWSEFLPQVRILTSVATLILWYTSSNRKNQSKVITVFLMVSKNKLGKVK